MGLVDSVSVIAVGFESKAQMGYLHLSKALLLCSSSL